MQSRLKFLLSLFSHSLGLSMGVCVRASPHWDVKMSVHCQAVSPSKQGPCGIRVQPIHLRTINSFLRALNRSSIKEAPVDLLLMITAWAIWPISGKTGQIRPKILQCVYHPFCGIFFTHFLLFFLQTYFSFLAVQDSLIGDLVTVVGTCDFSDNWSERRGDKDK